MAQKSVFFITLLLMMGVSDLTIASSDIEKLLPDSVEGWHPDSGDRTYTRENLYDYIDGGAELFLSYGFNRVISRTYAREDQPEIVVDIFDMDSAANAYGVFSMGREVTDTTVGQGAQPSSGLLLFWRNNYYVSILASPETAESKSAVLALARHIDAEIGTDGPLPGILDLLPEENLVAESVRYFHHHIWLNSHYFISHENILRIDEDSETVLARYEKGGSQHFLLLVLYPDTEKARTGLDGFIEHYLPEGEKSPTVLLEDGSWVGCAREGRLVIIVLNAENEHTVRHLVERVREQRTGS